MTDFSPLTGRLSSELASGKNIILAIDGNCTSGKTTLADMLARKFDAAVIHTDDFYLPKELRTPERYAEPGGNIDYARFLREVAPNLISHSAFSYRRFNCETMLPGDEVFVPKKALTIVEGSYSMHPKFIDLYDIKVGLTTPLESQLARVEQRDGKYALVAFNTRWIPLENKYLSEFQIFSKCDIVFRT